MKSILIFIAGIFIGGFVIFILFNSKDLPMYHRIGMSKGEEPEFTYHEIKMFGDSLDVMVNGKKWKEPRMEYVEGSTQTWTRHFIDHNGKDSDILFTLIKK